MAITNERIFTYGTHLAKHLGCKFSDLTANQSAKHCDHLLTFYRGDAAWAVGNEDEVKAAYTFGINKILRHILARLSPDDQRFFNQEGWLANARATMSTREVLADDDITIVLEGKLWAFRIL